MGGKLKDYNRYKGIDILSKQEFEDLYLIPKFNSEEQSYYFYVDQVTLNRINKYSSFSRILFILELGYFKASKQFHSFSLNQVKEDMSFILNKYYPSKFLNGLKGKITRPTQSRIRKDILEITNHKLLDSILESQINARIKESLSIDSNPKYIFYDLIRFFDRNNIVIPPYTKLQNLISKNLTEFENNLFTQLNKLLTPKIKKKIENLLNKESKSKRYFLTLIRLPAKGFSHAEFNEEILKKKDIEELFNHARIILDKLSLNIQSIKYAAKLVDRYRVVQIENFRPLKRYLYLLCFVYYRYLKVNDDLVNTLTYLIGKYYSTVKELSEKQLIMEFYKNRDHINKFSKIIEYLLDKPDFDSYLFGDVKRQKFYKILPSDDIKKVNNYIAKNAVKGAGLKWFFYDEKYHLIIKNIRPLFIELNFTFSSPLKTKHYSLVKAIETLQKCLRSGKEINWEKIPTNFISNMEKEHLIINNKLNTRRFEIYIYNKLKEKFISGDIYVKDSWEFKYFEDYLIGRSLYRKEKKEIHKKADLRFLDTPLKKTIQEKSEIADSRFHAVNKKILAGKNKNFQQKSGKDWSLKYESLQDEENELLYDKVKEIDLVNLLKLVQQKTNFLSEFEHIAKKRVKKPDENLLIAALIGYGNNMGPYKMEFSCNFSYEQLSNVGNTRFREETLLKANERIVNKARELQIFKHFNIDIGSVHSSSDGQKFSVGVKTIMARYSQKYFGLDKGLSVLTLNANFQPLASKVISANEYEGHHILDLLLMNESEIRPDIHSTDTHGVNEINYVLLNAFGYSFCPRYKTLNKRAEKLISPNPIRTYPLEYPIRPSRMLKKDIILEQEEEIKRVVASIALKKTQVGTIVKKISNLPYGNSLRKGFAELNRLIASGYILNFIDDMTFRRNIQKSLNRGESYHRLKRAVGYANGGKMIAKSESEQNVYQYATMVICSAIIYYNSLILSKMLENNKNPDLIKKTTPISWSTVNLYGKYIFSDDSKLFDFEKYVKEVK